MHSWIRKLLSNAAGIKRALALALVLVARGLNAAAVLTAAAPGERGEPMRSLTGRLATLATGSVLMLAGTGLTAAPASATSGEVNYGPLYSELLDGYATAAITVPETNCIDTVMSRAGWTTLVRPAVPERYGLRLLTPAGGEPGSAANFFIIDQYCEDITVNGEHSVPTTTTYVLAPITSIDGQPAPPGRLYTLYVGTNNPELFALFRSAGYPAEFLPTSSSAVTQISDASTQVIYTIDSSEWGHAFTVVSSPPQEPYVFDPGATYLYDGMRGSLSLTVVNDQGPIAPATISGTHLGSTLTEWLVTPLTLTNVTFRQGFRTGDHTLSLTWPPSGWTPSDSG